MANMDTVQAEVRAALEHLDAVEADIGVSPEVRARHQQDLLARIITMCREAAAAAEDRRESLRLAVIRMASDIENLATLLGEAAPTYPTDGAVTLEQRHQMQEQVLQSLRERYTKRMTTIRDLMDRIHATRRDLGMPSVQGADAGTDGTQSRISHLELELSKMEEEKRRRIQQARQLCTQIIQLWAELAINAQTGLDKRILQRELEHTADIDLIRQLESKRTVLEDERTRRMTQKLALLAELEPLWGKLHIPEAQQRSFKESSNGLSMADIDNCRAELERMRERKRHAIPQFIMDARAQLTDMWDKLYYPQERRAEFAIAFNTVFTEEALLAHEQEVAALEAKLAEFAPLAAMLKEHRQMKQDYKDFLRRSNDPSRLTSRQGSTNLLKEANERKRFAKKIPELDNALRAALTAWEEREGRPFLVNGVRYIDVIAEPDCAWAGTGAFAAAAAGATAPLSAVSVNTPRRTAVNVKPVALPNGASRGSSKLPVSRTGAKENGTPARSGTWSGHSSISESPTKRARMSS